MGSQKIAVNRQASYQYFITDKFEAGIVLTGTEVKSIREGRVSIKEAFVKILQDEVFVVGMHINPYSHAENVAAIDVTKSRKLLLHRSQIDKLKGFISKKGLTCVPLSLYFKRGIAKLEIGVAKGKLQHDKRQSVKKKMHERQMRQALKDRSK
jgi:SsrA-binding protein